MIANQIRDARRDQPINLRFRVPLAETRQDWEGVNDIADRRRLNQ